MKKKLSFIFLFALCAVGCIIAFTACGDNDKSHHFSHTVHIYQKQVAEPAYLKSDADCTHRAVYYYSCECGKKGTKTFEAGEPKHNYTETVADKYKKSDATCAQKAVYYKSCADCGKKGMKTFQAGEPTGNHDYTAETVTEYYKVSNADCIHKAVYYKSCAVCGAKGTETFETGRPTGIHKYTNEIVADEYKLSDATCTQKAVYYEFCISCGIKGTETFETGDFGAHKYDSNNVCMVCSKHKPSEGLSYFVNGDYAVVKGIGTCTDSEIYIADTYQGKPVTDISESAFRYCSGLTSVNIPNSVTWIGGSVFRYCSGLTSITIPNSVTWISSYAFGGCSGLTSITIPDSVTIIDNYAFEDCSGLTSITIPKSIISIYAGAFSGCNGLENITVESGNSEYHSAGNCLIKTKTNTLISGCKNSVIPTDDSVTSIGYLAFDGCSGLINITIPNTVRGIGGFAFRSCSGLTSITIPNSVRWIDGSAFRSCSGLTSITVESGNSEYHSAGNCLIETQSKTLILGCKNSVIPTDDSVTSIGQSAFEGCNGLTSITIPDSVTNIGDSAFKGCSNLTSVTIGNGIKNIDSYVFCNCTNLTEINYNGTKAEWNAIKKDYAWNGNTGDYNIICTDGTISKSAS